MTVTTETCDSCGPYVRAAAIVVKPSQDGSSSEQALQFCGHCLARHRDALLSDGWTISASDSILAKAGA